MRAGLLSLSLAAGLAGAGVALADHGGKHVLHLPAEQVQAAFAKGVPLVEQENYKVHASRRDAKPGLVEIHEKDTDILYVLSGTATLVTGGTVAGARTVAPEEIRGDSSTGGQERRLVPGDVVIVPAGVPHWFKEVPGPLTYYVVKVRAEGSR